MTGRPVLGDFLAAARRHLKRTAAQSGTSAPGRDAEEIIGSFRRLIMVLGAYAADLTTSFGELPDRDLNVLNPYARAAFQASDALSGAAASLEPAEVIDHPASGVAREFDAAAMSLRAGRDLLQTHFAPGHGGRRGRSTWAVVITSPPVTRALLAEIGALSRQAAAAGAGALPEGRPWPAPELGRGLNLACQLLAVAGNSGQPAYQHEPVSRAERNLLHALPGSALPRRRFPDGSELIPELCAGVIAASERVSHLAWTAAGLGPGSADISVTSWRRIAAAGTATSHHCHLLLSALATRSAQSHPGNASAIDDALERAAADARLSRTAWLRAGQALGQVTTDVRWRGSRTSAEAADLALWTGRLVYASPSWVPADGPSHPVRLPENLAPAPADVPGLVAALHYTAEALERLAVCNELQVRGAARAHRVLMPAKSFPDGSGTLDQFAPAPRDRTESLLRSCRAATKASARTASAAAGIAADVRAPSQTLTTARVAARPAPPAAPFRRAAGPVPGGQQEQAGPEVGRVSAGPVEARLGDLGVTSPRLLWRATGVDRLAQQVIADAARSRDAPVPSAPTTVAGNRGATRSVGRAPAAGRRGPGVRQLQPWAAQQEPEAEP